MVVVCAARSHGTASETVDFELPSKSACPNGVEPADPPLPRLSDWPFYFEYDQLPRDLRKRVSSHLDSLCNGVAASIPIGSSASLDGATAEAPGSWLTCRPLLVAADQRRPDSAIVYHVGVFRFEDRCIEGAGAVRWFREGGEWRIDPEP